MDLTFLGTSSGTPTRQRNVTGLALRLGNGALWLVDCGEATQHRLLETPLSPRRIERILLTHLHGDHCYGLPGLLSCLAVHGRSADQPPVELVGPAGMAAWVKATLDASYAHLGYPLTVRELALDQPHQLGERSGWVAAAYPIRHRVPCFGYVFTEAAPQRRFLVEQAAALGVDAGPQRGQLARGQAVTLADGRTITPDQVLGPAQPPRKVVVLGDTDDPSGIADAAAGCDLLLHECTYDASRTEQAHQWGHSTSQMAARFAARVGAKRLALTHFSARYTVDGEGLRVSDLLAEARAAAPGVQIIAADDLMQLALERAE